MSIHCEIEEINHEYYIDGIDKSLNDGFGILTANPPLLEAFSEMCKVDINFLGTDADMIYYAEGSPEKYYFDIDFIISTIQTLINCIKSHRDPKSLVNIANYSDYEPWFYYYSENYFMDDLEKIVLLASLYKKNGAKKFYFCYIKP